MKARVHLIRLAWRSLIYSKVKTGILVVAIALTGAFPLAVYFALDNYRDDLVARARKTPLILGKKGSRFDLVLHALYGRGRLPEPTTYGEVTRIAESNLASAIPLHIGNTARGYPLVGTSTDYYSYRGLKIRSGTFPLRIGDCVLGARVADSLGLAPGDKILSDARNVFDLAGEYPLRMTITGVLEQTGSADDEMVFTDLKSAWVIEGIGHGHEELSSEAGSELLLQRSEAELVANAAVPLFLEVTEENLESFHFHGERDSFPVTAVLVLPKTRKQGTLLKGRYVDSKVSVQLLEPEEVVEELLEQVFRVRRLFDLHMGLVIAVTGMWLGLVVALSLRLRARETQTMVKLGCARGTILFLHVAELSMVLVLGGVLGVVLAAVFLSFGPPNLGGGSL